jgi:hypothetical protein
MTMKHTLQVLTVFAAAMAAGAGMARAAQPEKVIMIAVGSQDLASPGSSVGTATALVSVTDPQGNPVTTLKTADLQVFTYGVPGNSCGFNTANAFPIKPGFYQITLKLPNSGSCHWVAGDYLAAIRINLPDMSGMAPFRVVVTAPLPQ